MVLQTLSTLGPVHGLRARRPPGAGLARGAPAQHGHALSRTHAPGAARPDPRQVGRNRQTTGRRGSTRSRPPGPASLPPRRPSGIAWRPSSTTFWPIRDDSGGRLPGRAPRVVHTASSEHFGARRADRDLEEELRLQPGSRRRGCAAAGGPGTAGCKGGWNPGRRNGANHGSAARPARPAMARGSGTRHAPCCFAFCAAAHVHRRRCLVTGARSSARTARYSAWPTHRSCVRFLSATPARS